MNIYLIIYLTVAIAISLWYLVQGMPVALTRKDVMDSMLATTAVLLFSAFWGAIWPGIAIFFVILESFVIVRRIMGIKDKNPINKSIFFPDWKEMLNGLH